jgi:hypothetical protein
MCYKFGIKQLYYFNTMDGQGEIDIDKLDVKLEAVEDEEQCESCVI